VFCAHINTETSKKQSVVEHLNNVSRLSKEYGEKASLGATAELIGLLHDMGKGTDIFNEYIHNCSLNPNDKSLKGKINHSTAGAKFIYDNFYNSPDPYYKLTAQIISLAICSHHGGLIDCLDLDGVDTFFHRMHTNKEIFYNEALHNFNEEYSGTPNIDNLFKKSTEEIFTALNKIKGINDSEWFGRFAIGMLEKYLLSCVIDADRYDTYTFMEGKEYKQDIDKSALWDELSDTFENKINKYEKSSKIDELRSEISICCKNFAKYDTGIYQLTVPTGGGKTLSSLRYAIEHAKKHNKDRIFYIIPYTTIIDQNAKEIRDILGREDIILEHHSNIISDNESEDYKLLTERWDSPIILTTMVQFLDTLFNGGTQGVRRMHNFANSIIIFDEIQTIPIKCINMFNSAINFLSNVCNTTIVLCTATQPLLSKTKMPIKLSNKADMVLNIEDKFKQLKRVDLVDKRIIGGYTIESLKKFILEKIEQVNSVLVILNTKVSARELFNELKEVNNNLCINEQYKIFHLSTNMCPANRMSVLKSVKESLGKEKVICISTQLIEAGVNISFECVVRSLAGLDSIIQAAGRCNRHGERECSNVYIVNVADENVERLVDIKCGQECTERVLEEFNRNKDEFDNDLLSPKIMERYYRYYFYNRKDEMNYTLPKPNNDKSMYDLLSLNTEGLNAYKGRNVYPPNLMLRQAFKTAGNNFKVIDQNTTGIIVPYGRGKEIITLINGDCSLDELKLYLREAQQYSVNIFDTDKRNLEDIRAITQLNNGGVLALKEGFYREDLGVVLEKQPMDFYNV